MSEVAQQIIHQFQSGHTSMSFLITGVQGVGKKKLVEEVAQVLLGKTQGALISGIKWVECGLTEEAKKAFQKAVAAGETLPDEVELEKKNEITMEEIRSGLNFISLKSTLPCKILVISLAEQMNENVQNALLKTLEEPLEKTLIFLLSENPNRLLPTILSRCQRIVLHPLSHQDLEAELKRAYPHIQDLSKVIQLSHNLPGVAKDICALDGLALYEQLGAFLCPLENLNIPELLKFLQDLPKEKTGLLKHFLLHFLYQCAQSNDLEKSQRFSRLYSWAEDKFAKMEGLYLDKSQVFMSVLLKIAETLS